MVATKAKTSVTPKAITATPVQSEVNFRTVLMTPEMATEILNNNTSNRHVRTARIDRYAAEMASGHWRQNGETISISKNNKLLNGQHRLMAVVKANVNVYLTLAEGVDEATFSTLDSGLTRTAGDVLSMRGIPKFNTVAAMTKLLLNYKEGSGINFGRTPQEIETTITEHPEIIPYASNYHVLIEMGRSVSASVCMIADMFGTPEDKAKIAQFVEGVTTGANLTNYDPRLLLRNKLIMMNQDRSRRPEQTALWYYTQRALTHYIGGSQITKLQTQRGVDPNFSEIPSAPRETVRSRW